MKNKIIRIGSRDSRLAVIQAEIVRDTIKKAHPDFVVEIHTMKTTGDMILDRSLDQIGGKGLFVKELDRALLEEEVDICVHSLKDMPMEQMKELPILAFTKREDPRDALIYKPGFDEIPAGGIIGSSSRRRTLQLARIFPDCQFRGIRGNVQTRLGKLETGEYAGTVLASAGLCRLQMQQVIGRIFSVEEVLPAAGQGILAIQGRAGETHDYLDCLQCKNSTIAAQAERSFVGTLDGGCSSPIAAYAQVNGEEVKLTGLYYEEQAEEYVMDHMTGPVCQAKYIGEKLAEELKHRFGGKK
ncbi:MAG: hydroxymethylbilane synthase [Hespellia sp.]|nr:hydroxymethylbilane synthase [Hespellia sp.]